MRLLRFAANCEKVEQTFEDGHDELVEGNIWYSVSQFAVSVKVRTIMQSMKPLIIHVLAYISIDQHPVRIKLNLK